MNTDFYEVCTGVSACPRRRDPEETCHRACEALVLARGTRGSMVPCSESEIPHVKWEHEDTQFGCSSGVGERQVLRLLHEAVLSSCLYYATQNRLAFTVDPVANHGDSVHARYICKLGEASQLMHQRSIVV